AAGAIDIIGAQLRLAEHADDERLAVAEAEAGGVAGRAIQQRQALGAPSRPHVGVAERRRGAREIHGEVAARFAEREPWLQHLDRALPGALHHVETTEAQPRPDFLVPTAVRHGAGHDRLAERGAFVKLTDLPPREHGPDP